MATAAKVSALRIVTVRVNGLFAIFLPAYRMEQLLIFAPPNSTN
ncbi:MAG: hypothetical protein JWN56_1001 [Sphingobacteriales bacterium]|nr:hypothetical protein [Sphingobacteriales bacterium]